MSASTLKIIALLTMIIDHIGGALFPQYMFFRYIGRIAFPIYSFFLVQGCLYTKNKRKYLTRLFLFALISEIPFDICFNSYYFFEVHLNINFFNNTNTIYTLFLGALLIFNLKEIENSKNIKIFNIFISMIFILMIFLISSFLNTDYNIWGLLLIFTFYILKDNKKTMLFVAFLLIAYRYIDSFNFIMFSFNILPLFLLYFYNNKKGLSLKWLFYISYPLHLVIIAIIKLLFINKII